MNGELIRNQASKFSVENVFIFVQKRFKKSDLFFVWLIVGLYLTTRLLKLDQWPIFSDEGIYIHWAKAAWRDAAFNFISLTDGRQPLQTWGTIPFLKLFPRNALFAGRFFSVMTGFIALLGIFTLLSYLFNKKTAFIGAFFYIFTPYFLFYDRMALVDSAVNASFIWILFFSILLAQTRRLDVALLFGLLAGLALLSKSSVRLFMGLSGLAPVLFMEKNPKKAAASVINFGLLFMIVLALGFMIYNIQRLSPFFDNIGQKDTAFIITFHEFRRHPFEYFYRNIGAIPLYVSWELGWMLVPLAFLGAGRLCRNDGRLFSYLMLWLIIPVILLAFFSRVLFPRYLIFLGTLIFILGIYFLSAVKNKSVQAGLLGLLLLSQLWFDYPILFKPRNLNFPPLDRWQYVEGPTAVWGARELVALVRARSQDKPVLLVTEGTFGLGSDVFDVFLKPNDRITIQGVWPLNEQDIFAAQKESGDKQVYFVFTHREEFPVRWPIKLIKKYTKPGGTRALYLFELNFSSPSGVGDNKP